MVAEKQEKVGKRFATDGCGIKARKGNGEYKKSQASKQKGDVDRINPPRASSCLIFHLIVSICLTCFAPAWVDLIGGGRARPRKAASRL